MFTKTSPKNLFYYPTTIALVDDNPSFLSAMELRLFGSFNTCTFSDPEVALTEINNARQRYQKTCNIHINFIQNNSGTVELSTKEIYQKIYNKDRFLEISSVVSDYDMPQINGVDFCKEILSLDHTIRKIMLTGKADSNIAISAFNNGFIDKFLTKGINDVDDDFISVILTETQKYFSALSNQCYEKLIHLTGDHPLNDEYKKIFEMTAAKSNFVEYYALDFSGSFLFLDKNANPTILIVKSNTDTEQDCEIAEYSDADSDIVSKLQEKSHLLYLLTEDDYRKSPAEWKQHLYPASLSDDKSFLYTVLESDKLGLNLGKVRSLDSFMQETRS